MVDLWVTLIINKARTHRKITQCPARIRQDVIAELKARGYDENGDPIVEVDNDNL